MKWFFPVSVPAQGAAGPEGPPGPQGPAGTSQAVWTGVSSNVASSLSVGPNPTGQVQLTDGVSLPTFNDVALGGFFSGTASIKVVVASPTSVTVQMAVLLWGQTIASPEIPAAFSAGRTYWFSVSFSGVKTSPTEFLASASANAGFLLAATPTSFASTDVTPPPLGELTATNVVSAVQGVVTLVGTLSPGTADASWSMSAFCLAAGPTPG